MRSWGPSREEAAAHFHSPAERSARDSLQIAVPFLRSIRPLLTRPILILVLVMVRCEVLLVALVEASAQ